MNGWDAVVSSLGTGLSAFREVSLLTVATGALVTAMTRNGVRLLVCISAFVAQDAKMSEGNTYCRKYHLQTGQQTSQLIMPEQPDER